MTQNSTALKAILIIAGLIGAGVGGAILFIPGPFHATTGIQLGDDVSLLNEIRASGGALLAAGVLVMSGAWIPKLAFTSIVVATLLYLSYGLSRVLSMAVDGMPDAGLVQVAVLELFIGSICLFALAKFQANAGQTTAAQPVAMPAKSMTAISR
jgi:Domain of unknown function (DUF4345)